MLETQTRVTSLAMDFVLIRPGEFIMGSPTGNGYNCEHPQRRVVITKPFYMATTPVTQAQWFLVMRSNPSYFKGKNLPVESVSWDDAQQFLQRLSQREGTHFRLPTEAEWEYACRAGTTTFFHFGDDSKGLREYGWYHDNSHGSSRAVAQKRPNPWALYDMHGNVWEWCASWYDKDYYTRMPEEDPPGPEIGSRRVVRGGSWYNFATAARSANRFSGRPFSRFYSLGFRAVRSVD